jgi:predicted AAA+ superfamily ATPase
VTRLAATTDARSFVEQFPEGCLVIDEVQRAPTLVLALKASVDRDRRPGRFVLTGSANLERLPGLEDSLAGRAESVELLGFSQAELAGVHSTFVDRVMAGDIDLAGAAALAREDYVRLACTGGYPEVVARPTTHRREAWFDNYVRRIVQRDVPDLARIHHPSELPNLLRAAAAATGSSPTLTALARTTNLSATTATRYLDVLETIYLVQRVPAWSSNRLKRVARAPKVALLDSGVAAHLMDLDEEALDPGSDPTPFGALVETFVLAELRKLVPLSTARPRLFHYRELDGAEVDVVLEREGRIVGIEVKASTTLDRKSTRWLERLRDKLGPRFTAGLVLYGGTSNVQLGDRLAAAPISTLWAA